MDETSLRVVREVVRQLRNVVTCYYALNRPCEVMNGETRRVEAIAATLEALYEGRET